MIGIGRRSRPLLVGLTTGALLVGVVAVARPAPVRPADLISIPASAPATTTTTPAPVSPSTAGAPATTAGGRPAAGGPPAGKAAASRAAAGAAAARAATRTTAAGKPSAAPSPRPSRTSSAPAPAPGGSRTAQVVALTNQARARAGCAALRVDPRLSAAAQGHSADMAANGYFAHDGLDGSSFADRIEAQGYPSPGGENIAQGQQDAQEVVTAWLNSPGHRANIEDCSFTAIGVGLAGADKYWTQDFGR